MSLSPITVAWYKGYVAFFFSVFKCPFESDAEAQAWEDGFNQAMIDWM